MIRVHAAAGSREVAVEGVEAAAVEVAAAVDSAAGHRSLDVLHITPVRARGTSNPPIYPEAPEQARCRRNVRSMPWTDHRWLIRCGKGLFV